jgi:hypothetical protein
MREASVHTTACLVRLWERLRRAAELPPDLARDGLLHHCSVAAESATAVHLGAEHPDGLVLERCRDELVQEQRLVEIPVMDDPDQRRTEFQNLLDIADLKVVRLSVDIRQGWQQVDELLPNPAARASHQTLPVARK